MSENFVIKFASLEHKKFYLENIKKCIYKDVYHESLIYTLGISNDCRGHIHEIFDFKTDLVKIDCIHSGWITSGSARVIRLAFNLYNNGTPTTIPIDEKDVDALTEEYHNYLPGNLFCCSYAPYFLEAIKIRFPEFCHI